MYDEMIEQVTQSVFATMFDIDLVRLAAPAPSKDSRVTAAVAIEGAWSGEVCVSLGDDLIRAATGKLLCLDSEKITDVDKFEVILEIANTIGGNLKSVLPSPSQLSLPFIADHKRVESTWESIQFTSETGNAIVAMFGQGGESLA